MTERERAAPDEPLVLTNRHTGERLELRRVVRSGETALFLRGSLPPHRQGPPLHVHREEAEEFHVVAGTLSAERNGHQLQVGVGERALFPAGVPHRWWNDGDTTLVAEGYATPLVDLDRQLQAAFDVVNSGPPDRPPVFYLAHMAWRHRRTQVALFMPRPLQMFVLPAIVFIGTLLGRYRGTDWPGSPTRCPGAP